MSTPIANSPLLPTQRKFPHDDMKQLASVCDYSYIDVASKVNARTIGVFPSGYQIATGEQWVLSGQPSAQNSLRRVYAFTNSTLTIAHGINFTTLTNFIRIFGCFYDGTSWQSLPYVDVTAVNKQVTIAVNSTNIVITKGVAAPTISSGLCVLEWISQK